MKVEYHYNTHKLECEDLNNFLTKAMAMVKKSAEGIQEEYKELNELEKKRDDLLKEKILIEHEIYDIEDENHLGHNRNQVSTMKYNKSALPLTEEEEKFQEAQHEWIDQVNETDHKELRMLNKVKRLESIVENTNLIISYIENNSKLYLSQLDNYIIQKPETNVGETMADIDNLCLDCSLFNNFSFQDQELKRS